MASRHKSEFLASMSHELRTPLNAVIGFSEVLLERMFGDINERQEEYLQDIHGSGQHLLELLNEILDLSKIEAGRMELEHSSFDRRAPLDDGWRSMVRERAATHGIALRVEVAKGSGSIEADELRFKQVLLNLLSNAVKFTAGRRLGALVRAVRTADRLRSTVTDTGIGVPRRTASGSSSRSSRAARGSSSEEGTGLGLTLSRRIVELLGGRLWLEQRGRRRAARSASRSRLPDATTSCRDDAARDGRRDRRHRGRPAVAGPDVGLPVRAALTGHPRPGRPSRPRSSAGEPSPAVVLLDIRLPGIDGWGVLAELKADPATRGIPVIVVSIVDERTRGLALGAADYLRQAGQPRRPRRVAAPRRRPGRRPSPARAGAMSARPDPGRRGQPPQPQAGPGRPRVRRLRGHRGDARARTALGLAARARPT